MPTFELWIHHTEENLPIVKERLKRSGVPYRLVQNQWIASEKNPHYNAMCEIEVDSESDGRKIRKAIGCLSHSSQHPGVYTYCPSRRYLAGQYLKDSDAPRTCATREVSLRQIMDAYEESRKDIC